MIVASGGPWGRYTTTGDSTDQIEEWVWRKVQQIVAQPDQLAALAAEHLRQTETATSSPQDLVSITTEIARKERVLTDTAVRYLEEGVPADVLKTATAKIQADLTDLRRRRDLMEAAAAEEADRSARLHSVSMVAKHMASRLPDLPHDQRRTVMDLLGLHVSVLGWEMCGTCNGKKKTSGGRGGQRCADCGAIGMVPLLVVEGALSSALYLDTASTPDVWDNDEPSLGAPRPTGPTSR